MSFQIKVREKIWDTEDLEGLYLRPKRDTECKEGQIYSSMCLSLMIS